MRLSILFYISLVLTIACENGPQKAAIDKTNTEVKITNTAQDIQISELAGISSKHNDLVLLDVRTSEEHAAGSIAGSINIDFYGANFKEEVAKLDKAKPYLVYCKSGGRSSKSGTIMEQIGFKPIYNLVGGYTAYASQTK